MEHEELYEPDDSFRDSIATINEEALLSLEAPVARVTGYDIIMPFLKNELKQLPSTERIVKAIVETMEF